MQMGKGLQHLIDPSYRRDDKLLNDKMLRNEISVEQKNSACHAEVRLPDLGGRHLFFLLNNEQKVQVSDTRNDATCTAARPIKKSKRKFMLYYLQAVTQ
jgi:hypothetical protein